MGFTVQHLGTNDGSTKKGNWAVLLDHEHVMFVGDYRQCEEWLDFHDIVESTFDHSSQGCRTGDRRTLYRSVRGFIGSLAKWCRSCRNSRSVTAPTSSANVVVRGPVGVWNRAKQAAVSFLSGDAGHCQATEIVAAGLLLGIMYFGTMFLALTLAWDRVALSSMLLRMPRSPRAAVIGQQPDYGQDGSPDIACDLASSAR